MKFPQTSVSTWPSLFRKLLALKNLRHSKRVIHRDIKAENLFISCPGIGWCMGGGYETILWWSFRTCRNVVWTSLLWWLSRYSVSWWNKPHDLSPSMGFEKNPTFMSHEPPPNLGYLGLFHTFHTFLQRLPVHKAWHLGGFLRKRISTDCSSLTNYEYSGITPPCLVYCSPMSVFLPFNRNSPFGLSRLPQNCHFFTHMDLKMANLDAFKSIFIGNCYIATFRNTHIPRTLKE